RPDAAGRIRPRGGCGVRGRRQRGPEVTVPPASPKSAAEWGGYESERFPALLALADGELFEGEAIGAPAPEGIAGGELVFNTVLSGYQEVITDPSYAGQVVTFTYPHIGNYGTTPTDDEAPRPRCRGVVVRDVAPRPSSWRSQESLDQFLVRHDVPGITGVDTRRLTRHVRAVGA